MATTQYCKEITTAELIAMIALEGLDEGRLYNITDAKKWIMARSNSTYVIMKDQLHIFNTESLPGDYAPEILHIDTGIVIDDISTATGTPLEVVYPSGYHYVGMEVEIGALNTITDIAYVGNELTATDNIAPGFRAILEFHTSEMSETIPTPTLLSASTNVAGTKIIATFDHVIKDPSSFAGDFSMKINGVADVVASVASGVDKKTIEITSTSAITNGKVVIFSFTSGDVMNSWGGLLATITDAAVTNIVP